MQVTEAVASVVACLEGDSQAAATLALLEPIMSPLQGRLQQQQQQNGAGPAPPAPEDMEYVGAFVDRLGTVFK